MKYCVATCLLVSAQLAGASAAQGELRITIRLHKIEHVPQAILQEAERQTVRIFENAGVATDWMDCSAEPDQQALARCFGPVWPTEVTIEFLPVKMVQQLGADPGNLGGARLPAGRVRPFATDAYICPVRVTDLAVALGQDEEVESLKSIILAGVIAHEVGHLLGIRNHSVFGIMHSVWTRQEVSLAEQGRLLFTADEKRVIESEVRARVSRQLLISELRH